MCPTLLGRLQTRIAAVLLPALVACALAIVLQDDTWPVLAGVWLVCGAALDAALYRPLVKWQPPALSAAMALFEWAVLLAVATALDLGPGWVSLSAAYWCGWGIGQVVQVAVLPVVFITRLEEAGEVGTGRWGGRERRVGVSAAADSDGPLPARLSEVWGTADRAAPLPPPSDIGPIPDEFLALLKMPPALPDGTRPPGDR